MEEIWKDIFYVDIINDEIVDFRGLYQVSNLGNIKSMSDNHRKHRNKILKTRIKTDYVVVNLSKNGKSKDYRVHRLVAYMFIPNNDKNKWQVNHKDENHKNNNVNNLEWCTPKYNSNYGTRNERGANNRKGANNHRSKSVIGINKKNKTIIKYEYIDLCKNDGFLSSKISECCRGKRKSHKGYKWYYLEDYLNMATLSEADLETSGTCND